jgi:hypothetical protein
MQPRQPARTDQGVRLFVALCLNPFVDQGRTWWVVEPFLCSGSQIM